MDNLNDASLLDIFRMEVEGQIATLTRSLLALEKEPDPARSLADLMRAAHSLKGGARIVGRKSAVRVAHAMEDCFVAAQKQKRIVTGDTVDILLGGVDLLGRVAQVPEDELSSWETSHEHEIESFLSSLSGSAVSAPTKPPSEHTPEQPEQIDGPMAGPAEKMDRDAVTDADRVVRVTAANLSRLMGLAGEAVMASRWLTGFAGDMVKLKGLQAKLGAGLDKLREDAVLSGSEKERVATRLNDLHHLVEDCRQGIAERLADLDLFDRRFVSLSSRLYHEVLDCRMRPFRDGIHGFPRMVRDVSRVLGKTVRFEIKGENTPVDRDILEALKAPLDHILRNAIDHGAETNEERRRTAKPAQVHIWMEASHSAGLLHIIVADDGRGVDLDTVRKAVVEKGLTTAETSQAMSAEEIMEFLFLPGFSLKNSVSEISGRGVGLDVVQAAVKGVGGRVRVSSQFGTGTQFHLELPLTLSVIRTLLVEVGGEPYAFPLAHVDRAMKVARERIQSLEGREHFSMDNEQVGLVAAHQVMDLPESAASNDEISLVVLRNGLVRYGVVVDRFLGERELVVRPLDNRLGKVKNISSAALMPDGSPVLIVDVADFVQSVEALARGRQLSNVGGHAASEVIRTRKRVLVVDDSLTVRELERKLLDGQGYVVDTAVDGMDGWNAIRSSQYDLVITDVDMPRLDGVELLTLIRQDNRYRALPVMIVSYKDRPEDRNRGLEAGADHYLTKASFHDETLLQVVKDLIGDSGA